ncbi:hypothetical protein HK096_009732, partial [Nowakowskiella sp. JEL0078]
MRMVATTCLAVASGIFTYNEPCATSAVPCTFTHSRNMATSIAYSLYYLDYFAIKFYDVLKNDTKDIVSFPQVNNMSIEHKLASSFELRTNLAIQK